MIFILYLFVAVCIDWSRSAESVDPFARERRKPVGRARREKNFSVSLQSCSPFSHSLQTFRSKTARIRMTDQRKKYDCFAVYCMYFKK